MESYTPTKTSSAHDRNAQIKSWCSSLIVTCIRRKPCTDLQVSRKVIIIILKTSIKMIGTQLGFGRIAQTTVRGGRFGCGPVCKDYGQVGRFVWVFGHPGQLFRHLGGRFQQLFLQSTSELTVNCRDNNMQHRSRALKAICKRTQHVQIETTNRLHE